MRAHLIRVHAQVKSVDPEEDSGFVKQLTAAQKHAQAWGAVNEPLGQGEKRQTRLDREKREWEAQQQQAQ